MDLETYERSGRTVYEGLAEVVAIILAAAIAQDPALRPQQIQHRAKDPTSLRQKLKKADVEEEANIEPHAKDLAGARAIFYTSSDVGRFQTSRILTDNFEVDWDRTKFHHPTSEDPDASELFDSSNYVVRLKDERATLPEYARFAGLWCEVQVQTTLNHAWAEMAHDTIYKKPELSGFGGNLMEGIEARMKAIMRDYLAPAGYAFQKVLSDFDRLSQGQALFEQGIITAIENAADNNELHETLERFSNSVLPYYDDHQSVAADILTAVAAAVKRARQTPVRAIETPFGNLDGKTSKDVATAAAHIVKDLRFVDVEQTFAIICDLYLGAASTDEAACWVNLAKELAEHDLRVWQQAGPIVQLILVERIRALSDANRLALKPIVFTVLKKVFSTELSGATSNFDSITLHEGAIAPSDAVRQMRRAALQFLHTYDAAAQDDAERGELADVYRTAMAMPHLAQSQKPKLAAIVFENATDIISRYTDRVDDWSYEQRQKVEHDLLWMHRHCGSPSPVEEANAGAEEARSGMVAAIRTFRDRVNADDGFTTYKLLVGFESVFPPAWDAPGFGYEEEEAYREQQIDAVIAGISADNASKWLAIIRRCAATQSNDLATFPTFAKFLERLSVASPQIVLGYLGQLDARLANFLPSMLRGLSQTSAWPDTEAKLRAWIVDGRFLSDIGWAFGSVEAMDIAMLRDTLSAAITAGDENAAFSIIRSIAARDGEGTALELKRPFLDAVAFMAERNDPRWINGWWSKHDKAAMLASLTDDETVAVLDSLVSYPRVETRLEWFLAGIAESCPQLVIDYFGKRLVKRFFDGRQGGYDAIPYSLARLKDVLVFVPGLIARAARGWFEIQPEYFSYYGGKFVEVMVPEFSPGLESALKAYVATGNREDTHFVVEVLRAYSGQSFLQPLCKEIIAALPDDDPLRNSVEIALQPSGVTTGEFGHVARLKQHREDMGGWASDQRELVRSFAATYVKRLDNSIAAEQRRSEESLALRKLEYDRPGSTNDTNDTTED